MNDTPVLLTILIAIVTPLNKGFGRVPVLLRNQLPHTNTPVKLPGTLAAFSTVDKLMFAP